MTKKVVKPADGNGNGAGAGAGDARTGGEGRDAVRLTLQREVDRQVQKRLAEIMTSAGVNVNRVSLEVLYMMPADFVRLYIEMFTRALGSADGGTAARGKAAENTGALGKAKRKTAGGQGKKYKEHWVVQDEKALDLKTRVDKRLRALGRDIRKGLAGEISEAERARCVCCSSYMSADWIYCPSCGTNQREAIGNL